MTTIRSASAQDLVEVLADQEHPDALLGGLPEIGVHGLDRADVEARGRRRGDQHLRLARELAAEDELLEVAAGEVARRLCDPGVATP